MSLGYEGFCQLIEQDAEIAIYKYSGANCNNILHKGHARDYDGVFIIYKKCLEEPEIHIKIKKRASGRKYESKKIITHIPNISKHIQNGDIVIEHECKNAFRRYGENSIDYIAQELLINIFIEYQKNGALPEKTAFIQ